jgi:predicted O-methyltransferase YrrM
VTEPATAAEVAAWINAASRRRDPYEDVRVASHRHREQHGHGCTVFPTSGGPLLGVLAAAIAAERVLEVGTGLGYSALCLASAGAAVETIEGDPRHARLARSIVAERRARVDVVEGRAIDVLRTRSSLYDLVFCDADPAGYADLLDEFTRLLRGGGLLISANLFLAQFADDIRGLDELARYRERVVTDERLRTAFVPGGMALSVRR